MREIRIALVGDQSATVPAHQAIPLALGLVASAAHREIRSEWIPTPSLSKGVDKLRRFDAVWVVPGSPYASMAGALAAITYARVERKPFLGTCGGFQHAVIEHARNVKGVTDADHEESQPDGKRLVISRLMCPLRGVSQRLTLTPGSRLAQLYASRTADEQYQCSFGVNAEYQHLFSAEGLAVAARNDDGEVRAVELHGHPFFVATLFQPERSASTGKVHPLINAFVVAAGA